MGFLCKIKENKYLDNPLDRDLGLSNIYNVNSVTNFCFESFNGPTYFLSGATKAITGTTSPCSGTPTNCYAVYNFSEIDDFDLNFIITGSTDYTGYTGEFCYKVYNRTNFNTKTTTKLLNITTPTYESCINFSAITSNTITQNFSISKLPFLDNDYMLRSYYKFTPKNCVKNEINTWDTVTQLNKFDYDYDWYFLTVRNPPTPAIVSTVGDLINRVTLYQEIIQGSNFQNFFTLGNQPIDNKINLYVNGIRLTEGLDYNLNTSKFPNVRPIVEILSGNIESEDIITIVYLIGPQSFLTALGQSRTDLFEIETFQVTGFTTNITASTVNIINTNTVKGTQEAFLTKDFDPLSDVVVVVNGVTLKEDIEYYKSSTTPNKIIFNPNFTTIKIGDIVSFWYFTTKLSNKYDLGTLDKNSVRIQWSVDRLPQQDYNTGEFVLEVTEKSDTNWTSLFYTNKIPYVNNIGVYENNVINLLVNKDYKFRVIFEKTYKNILNEDIITSSEVIGYFNTKNDKIIYGY